MTLIPNFFSQLINCQFKGDPPLYLGNFPAWQFRKPIFGNFNKDFGNIRGNPQHKATSVDFKAFVMSLFLRLSIIETFIFFGIFFNILGLRNFFDKKTLIILNSLFTKSFRISRPLSPLKKKQYDNFDKFLTEY